ncbi:lactate dehydrogenase-like 2-hydroxyacid dehydrogenase [Azomonas agilis]|uniref:Lactate dehydrogenase-like 2-hydroxyacid dehydrogenase n=1 Tax=Azomonas agilis TaxID=116849 RepID=A0A562IZC1_9GAMM|nr:2-hydroxyacid dehydrogenase [Azomonas agilis]TWH75914.1 lactate dehydrogenase-like 2-hydroxyacid dehydrogenase [Azomonas agilis]
MTNSTIDVLVWGPLHEFLMQALARDFKVHKRWEIKDLDAWVADRGPHVRAVVTSGVYGLETALLERLSSLEVVTSFGVGYDAIDTAYLAKRGIRLSNTPDVLNNAVAETALALMLCLTRRISEAERFVRAGKWTSAKFPLGRGLTGKTCGIVGLGKIGKTIAKRAAAFNMEIAYFRRGEPYPDVPYTHYSDLKELARQSDYLVVIVPGGPETKHLINREVMQALGSDSYLINVARGSVMDEQALIASLQAGEIAGAALDVFEDEPRVPTEFFSMDNLVLTPHLGSGTYETRQAMAELVFTNLSSYFNQGKLVTPVNLD